MTSADAVQVPLESTPTSSAKPDVTPPENKSDIKPHKPLNRVPREYSAVGTLTVSIAQHPRIGACVSPIIAAWSLFQGLIAPALPVECLPKTENALRNRSRCESAVQAL